MGVSDWTQCILGKQYTNLDSSHPRNFQFSDVSSFQSSESHHIHPITNSAQSCHCDTYTEAANFFYKLISEMTCQEHLLHSDSWKRVIISSLYSWTGDYTGATVKVTDHILLVWGQAWREVFSSFFSDPCFAKSVSHKAAQPDGCSCPCCFWIQVLAGSRPGCDLLNWIALCSCKPQSEHVNSAVGWE